MSSYCNSNSKRIIIAEVVVIIAVITITAIGMLAVHAVVRIAITILLS